MVSDGADPKIRIYDAGMKKYSCDAFPACVHLVRYVLGRERRDAFATRKQTLLGRAGSRAPRGDGDARPRRRDEKREN